MADALRVVVVEDEGLIRMDVVATLQEAGYEVVGEGADGEEAIKLATELEPDLVVMDIQMPHVSGLDLIEAMQSEADLKPLQMTLDALALGKRVALPHFEG